MEKQETIDKFMITSKPVRGEPLDCSDLEVQSFDPDKGKPDRRQPVIIGYLSKFSKAEMDVMAKYLEENRYQLSLPPRQKMGLFDDIWILYEFRKDYEFIKANRVKAMETISQRLQTILKRAKVTIRQRITRKISRCSVQQVMDAIKNKRDLNLDKNHDKAKKIPQISSKSTQDIESLKIKRQSSEDLMSLLEIKKDLPKMENQSKIIIPQQNINSSADNQPGNRVYKYGKKEITHKIFIYVNRQTKQVLPFVQSTFNDLKSKFQCSLPLPKPTEKVVNIPKKVETKVQQPKSNFATPLYHDLKNLPRDKLDEHIRTIKEQASNALNQCNPSEANELHKQLLNSLEQIQSLQVKLEAPKKSDHSEDIMAEILNVGSSPSKRCLDSTGKKTTEEKSSNQDHDVALSQKKLLYKLNNNIRYLNELKQDPSLQQKYLWTEAEDNLLFAFRFNPQAYHNEIVCLLRYKGRDLMFERMRFLNIDTNINIVEYVNKLQRKQVEPVKEPEFAPEELIDRAPEELMHHPLPEELMELQ